MATNHQVIPSTGPVASSSQLSCAHCARRGHRCPADRMDDGTATCIWCLDGLPCAFEQRQKREQVSGAASPLSHKGRKGGVKRAPSLDATPEKPSSPQRFDADFVERRMAEHRQANPPPPPPTIPAPEEAPRMQSATTTSTQKTNGHAPAGVRLCKCGCGATVPATNRFNFIRGHMKRKSAKRGSRGPYNTKKESQGTPQRSGSSSSGHPCAECLR